MRTKSLKMNVIIGLLGEIFSIVSGLILPKLMVSVFGSADNGLVSSIGHFLGFSLILHSGLGSASRAVLFKPIADKDMQSISSIMSATKSYTQKVSLMVGGYVMLVALIYPFIVLDEYNWGYVFSLVLVIGSATFADNFFGMKAIILLQADQKYYIHHLSVLITNVVTFGVSVLLIWLDCSLITVKVGATVCSFLNPIMLNLYVKKHYDLDWHAEGNNAGIKQRWDAFAQQMSTIVNANIDLVLLTLFVTLEEVSVYTVHLMIISNIKRLVQSFFSGTCATLGDMIAKNQVEHLRKSFFFIEWAMLVASAFMLSVTAIMIVPFIKIYMYGADIDYVMPTFAFVMSMSGMIECLKNPYSALVDGAGRFKETRNIAIAEIVVNVVASLLCVLFMGMVGVIVGTIIAAFMKTFAFAIYSYRKILDVPLKHFFINYFLYVAVFLIIVYTASLVQLPNDLNYFSWAGWACLASAYSGAILLLVSFINNRKELAFLKEKLFQRSLFKK